MKITIEYNGEKYEIPTTLITPVPPPVPPPPSKYVLVNCINWNLNALNALPLQDGTEFTYFVLPVASNGTLLGTSSTLEAKFVADVHSAGKKATFSIAGGTNNVADITAAVNQKTSLVNAIKSHITQFGYDGVTVDIENTAIDAQAMKDFITLLRVAIPDKIIGCYTQNYQLNTVWAKIGEYANAFDWVSYMEYDSGFFNLSTLLARMNLWAEKVGKNRLLAGIATNYPPEKTGLSVVQYGQVLDLVNNGEFKGVGIWNNVLFAESWRKTQRIKLPNIV